MQCMIGFGKYDFSGFAEAKTPPYAPLDACATYIEGESSRALVVALDLVQLSRQFCDELRAEIAAATGLSRDEIHTHCTHDHATPFENDLLAAGGAKAFAAAIRPSAREAIESARPALFEFIEERPASRLNITRRQWVDGSAGAFTVWMGYDMKGDRPDAGASIRERMRGLTGSDDIPEALRGEVFYERPVDDLVQGLVFRDPDSQEAIGAIVRFSAHAVASCHAPSRAWGGDFPYFCREAIERELGCPCQFLSGPCGDIAVVEDRPCPVVRRESPGPGPFVTPKFPSDEAAIADAKRSGEAVARCILDSPRLGRDVVPLEQVRCSMKRVELVLRDSVVETIEEARELKAATGEAFDAARSRGEPVSVLRPLAEAHLEAGYMPMYFDEYYYASQDEVRARRFAVELPRIEIGDVLIAGFPGEACQAATGILRDRLDRPVITLTEMNGDCGYMAPKEEFPGGDYEVNCSIIVGGGLEQLAEAHLSWA